MTCTIDAGWAPGKIVGHRPSLPVLDPDHLHSNSSKDENVTYVLRDDNTSIFVTLAPEWLNVLTPTVNPQDQDQDRTTLIESLGASGLYNASFRIRGPGDLNRAYKLAGSAITSLITDAMSRIGIDNKSVTISSKHLRLRKPSRSLFSVETARNKL
jgi:hypothetical protein